MALTHDMLARVLGPIRRRLRLIVSRAILTADADDSKACQRLDLGLLADESRKGVARIQQYGLTSRPPEGSEAVVVAAGGVRGHMVAVAVDATADRPTGLQAGEVALWMQEHGIRVLLADDGHLDLGTEPSDYVALARPVKADFDALKGELDAIKEAFTTHTHPVVLNTLTASPTTTALALSWSPSDVAAEEVRAK